VKAAPHSVQRRPSNRAAVRAPGRAVWEAVVASQDDLECGTALCRAKRPVFVSEGFCRIAGKSREDLLAMGDITSLFADAAGLAPALGGGAARAHSETLLVHGGASVALSVRGTGARGENVLVMRDVTRGRRAELELRHSEEKRRALFEAGNNAIFLARDTRITE